MDKTGVQVVTYSYDAWGNLLGISSTKASTIGTNNPLRYRGYVYDTETNLYYLQSRYYNPEIGRFINADSYVSTGQGLLGNNMFAYCGNNAVMYNDPSGEFPWLIVIIITGAAIIGGYIGYNYNDKMGSTVTEKDLYADAGVPYPDHIRDAENSDQQTDEELSTTDRVKNTIIGASAGLAIGGVLVSAAGVIGSVAVGSATSTIPIFGATGLQTFAIGALAYDFVAMVIAPFFGIEMEPIEYEP